MGKIKGWTKHIDRKITTKSEVIKAWAHDDSRKTVSITRGYSRSQLSNIRDDLPRYHTYRVNINGHSDGAFWTLEAAEKAALNFMRRNP